jgi:hypothetical protein
VYTTLGGGRVSGGAVYPISKREFTGGSAEVALTRGEFAACGGGRGPDTGPEATRWPDGLVAVGIGRMPWGAEAAESGRGRAEWARWRLDIGVVVAGRVSRKPPVGPPGVGVGVGRGVMSSMG